MAALLGSPYGRGRPIGPIGTTSRIVAGIAATTLPVALEGIGWWDLPALLAAPLVATAAATLITRSLKPVAADALDARHAICSAAGCLLIGVLFAAAFALGEVTPAHGDVVFWGFFGASMLLGAVRGDSGCEVLAFPNAITGRRDRIGCILFTPMDAAETRHRGGGRAGSRVRQAVR